MSRKAPRVIAASVLAVLIGACSTRPSSLAASKPTPSDAGSGKDADANAPHSEIPRLDGGDSGMSGIAGKPGDGKGEQSDAGGGAAHPTDPCLGMTCESPPRQACVDGDTRRTHERVGSCIEGSCVYESHDEACVFGCDRGDCAPDPCVGRTCTTPPGDSCEDDGHLHVYDTIGSCSAGECTYGSRVLTCTCVDDACTSDPCPNITCDTPPNPFCPSTSARRSFASAGTCNRGACSYEPTDTPCEFGCTNGTCNPDPCAAVTCTTPPAPSCPDSNSLRSYRSPGTCSDGACSYEATETSCADDQHCSGGACRARATDPVVPAVTVQCPAFRNASITFMGLSGIAVQAGAKAENATAPMVFYWHGTGSIANEYMGAAAPVHAAVLAEGGVLISFQGTTGGDVLSGSAVFGAGDFELTDQLVACAVRDHNVDPNRIFTTGCSSGGLFAAAMAARRSSYIAAVATNSGGWSQTVEFQDDHTPALMTMHGASGVDFAIIDFVKASETADIAFEARGGFVINCDHGGYNCGAADLYTDVWEFFRAHPYGTNPSPWASALPTGFDPDCAIFE